MRAQDCRNPQAVVVSSDHLQVTWTPTDDSLYLLPEDVMDFGPVNLSRDFGIRSILGFDDAIRACERMLCHVAAAHSE
jgi:hypothetical protein